MQSLGSTGRRRSQAQGWPAEDPQRASLGEESLGHGGLARAALACEKPPPLGRTRLGDQAVAAGKAVCSGLQSWNGPCGEWAGR